jgi:putative RecB family exonuclease
MAKRKLSPSSINLYKQCPRRWYYRYIKRLKTTDSIHLIRGSIAHSVLEHVFDQDPAGVDYDGAMAFLGKWMLRELRKEWNDVKERLESLGISSDRLLFYFDETRTMLRHWLTDFLRKCQKTDLPFPEAFKKETPLRELRLESEEHNVMGFIDVVEMIDEKIVRVIDYKTSAKDKMSDDYRLQLAIYALLVRETYGYAPVDVVINFLKFGERSITVDQELIEYAKKECAWVTERTQSVEPEDYPRKESPLCKWQNARGAGQCDFYDACKES